MSASLPAAESAAIFAEASEALSALREVRDYAIYMIDPNGRVLTWNEGAQKIKGYRADEIVGDHFSRFFAAEDRDSGKPQRLLARAAAEGRIEDEAWRVRKDGTRFWANVVITAVHDKDGGVRGFIKVTRDLTERRSAEELLRQSEERLRLLVESVKDYAIFMLDANGRVVTWNAGAERIKGYGADEIIGRHFSVFYPPEAEAQQHAAREIELATREGRYEEEGWRVRKDGTRFWANVVLTAIHDPRDGTLRGFAKVTRDLTERRQMEEKTRSAVAQAEVERTRADYAQKALQERDEFISVAAHELRTPLTAIIMKLQGAVRLVEKNEDDGGAAPAVIKKRLDGAVRQVERLSELVEGLLDVSRIVRGKMTFNFESVDLKTVVAHVVEDFREASSAAGSELRVAAPDTIDGVWDRGRIEQVVINLLSNAIKYGAGKPVDVSLEKTPGGARLRVRDSGIGIAADDVQRLFMRFERFAPSQNYGGLGLGLYITKNIVEAHGGTIRVETQPNVGSTFIVDLPSSPPKSEVEK